MTHTHDAHELLLRIMGVDAEDADVPMPVLVNMHRAQLRAPLAQLDVTYGGRAQSPWMRSSLIIYKVEQRWPSLKDGQLFSTDVLLNNLVNKLPAHKGANTKQLLELARNPTPVVSDLLRMAWDGWVCVEPLVLLHELTHHGVDASELEIYERLLARELELDPAVEDMLRTFAPL